MWQNLKVVELASVLAGPLVGSFFSELGAQVIKIENKKTGGDVTRTWKLKGEDQSKAISAYYASANFNKKSVLLDLEDPVEYQLALEFILDADIIIMNFKSEFAKNLKLDSNSLLELKKELIIGNISGFGKDSSRLAFDVVLQAETGYLSMNGSNENDLAKMPVALIDVIAAHHLKEAILIALLEKQWSGKGKEINISLYDAALASLANQASNYLMEGHIAKAMGTKHPNIAPYGDKFICLDGKAIILAVGSDKQFSELCKVLDIEEKIWLNFKSNSSRLEQREELVAILQGKISLKTESECLLLFEEKKIPAASIKNLAEVFKGEKAQALIQNFLLEGYKAKRVKTLLQ